METLYILAHWTLAAWTEAMLYGEDAVVKRVHEVSSG